MNANEVTTTAEAAAIADPAASQAEAPKDRKPASKKASKGGKATAKRTAKKAAKPAAKKQAKATGTKASKGTPKPEHGQPREGSKKEVVLDLLCRKDGATLAQIAEATGWQNHSIRGFISTVTKKLDLPIASLKKDAGDRFYRIEK